MNNIRGVDVKVLDTGNLEVDGGLIIPNPMIDLTFPDPNSAEWKGELWRRIWAEDLHNTKKQGRIKAILLNLLEIDMARVMDAIR